MKNAQTIYNSLQQQSRKPNLTTHELETIRQRLYFLEVEHGCSSKREASKTKFSRNERK